MSVEEQAGQFPTKYADCRGTAMYRARGKSSLDFVILNEVKNLAHPTDKILRCTQDDK